VTKAAVMRFEHGATDFHFPVPAVFTPVTCVIIGIKSSQYKCYILCLYTVFNFLLSILFLYRVYWLSYCMRHAWVKAKS
jgi:hypothetical protein